MDKHDKHHKPKHGHDKHNAAHDAKKPQVAFSDMSAAPLAGEVQGDTAAIMPHGKHVKKH